MHEFELGVWKALLTHLVRILHSLGAETVQEFNHRYTLCPWLVTLHVNCNATIYLSFRQISSFGSSSTIRRFTHNVADMKKLAARDFEDILQVTYVVCQDPRCYLFQDSPVSVLYSLLWRITSCAAQRHCSQTSIPRILLAFPCQAARPFGNNPQGPRSRHSAICKSTSPLQRGDLPVF